MRLRTVIVDMQSSLYAGAVRRSLAQELTEVQVVVSPHPEETAAQCRLLRPYALLMEVTDYTPWKLEERLKLRNSVRRDVPDCRIVLLADEMNHALAEEVKRAKQAGLADAFLFTSATEGYLAAVLDSF